MLFSLCRPRKRRELRDVKKVLIILGVACLTICLFVVWTLRFPAKARALDPVLDELAQLHGKNGVYPTSPSSLPSVQRLSQHYSLYFGERTQTNLLWNASEVSSHDLSILVETNFFVMFAPTGRIKPWSFSSFPVWRRDSDGGGWEKGRIHWSFGATYWSVD